MQTDPVAELPVQIDGSLVERPYVVAPCLSSRYQIGGPVRALVA
jgi:hypothetical protein